MKTLTCLAALFGSLSLASPALACSSCGCNLTSDWLSQGLVAQPGTTIGIRYDYVPQTELRSGQEAVNRNAITLPTSREIEQNTYNHYATLTVDHAFNPQWAINVQVPFSWHPHHTISPGDTDQSYSRTDGLGDVRAALRYQGFGGPGVTGVQLGIKLPTGGFHQNFLSGPSAGSPVDRGLQAGTGTTDLTLGIYHFGKLAGAFDYVLQVQSDVPLNSRELYRPGVAVTVSAGIQYMGWHGITPQVQLNLRVAAKDSGANSDRDNSGGEHFYIAPGLTAQLSSRLSAYGIVQLPIYRRVNGYQLTPRVIASFGVMYRM